jgi:tRNA (guanine-N7-)-methyltransferase
MISCSTLLPSHTTDFTSRGTSRTLTTVKNSWANPYLELVHTKNSLILASSATVTAAERAEVQAKISQYQHVCVELGSGSGNHLIEQAARAPNTIWIGFELRFKRTFRTAEKAEARGITNLLVIRNAAEKLPEYFPLQSIDALYVNFPDPWDKRRWKKHRMIQESSLQVLAKYLKPGGFFLYKTDHRESFEDVHHILTETAPGNQLFTVTIATDNLHGPHSDPRLLAAQAQNVQTEFEGLFLSQGLPIYMLEAQLRG